jgi:SAM-dependent methyltransferase
LTSWNHRLGFALFINDGQHYDAVHASLPDVEFWVQKARQAGGDVLELACGTGRLSLPIAAAGLNVVGIDVSEPFLSCAKQKAAGRNLNARFERADIRHFALPNVFQFVAFPFRSVAVLISDQDLDACFACVRRHVDRGAMFIVDAFNPSRDGTVPSPAVVRYESPEGSEIVEVGHERRYDPVSRVATSVFTYFLPVSREPIRTQLSLRLYTAAELSAALRANGFQLVDHLGGYDGAAYTEEAPLQLLAAQAV